MHFLIHALVILSCASVTALGASPSRKAGMDSARLSEIPKRMLPYVESNVVSGVVTLVARHGEIVALDAVGHSDLGSRRKMRTDDLFWIASMTKPMAAVAVLMLQDEGRLSVNDPVQKHLPEFTNQWMVASRSATNAALVRAPRAILIRDLLTHTSGLGDMPAPRGDCSLAELVMAYAREPLKFPPGSKWEYCNSGINTLGRIVEVVSDVPFAEFMQKRLFNPLDMDDTTFWPSASQAKQIVKSYRAGTNGALEEAPIFFIKGPMSDRKRTPYPSGGLFSTARDVSRFYQMMLDDGTFRGKRLLSQEAVAQMTRTQTGEIKTGFVDGMSWGYGFAVVKEPKGITGMLAPGTFGHGGAYGTQSWADPKKDLILVLMYQWARVPNADASPLRAAFQEAATAAIVE